MGPARAPFKATRTASNSRAEPLVVGMLLRASDRRYVGPEDASTCRSCSKAALDRHAHHVVFSRRGLHACMESEVAPHAPHACLADGDKLDTREACLACAAALVCICCNTPINWALLACY